MKEFAEAGPIKRSQSHQHISHASRRRWENNNNTSELDVPSRNDEQRLASSRGIYAMGFYALRNGTLGHRGIPSADRESRRAAHRSEPKLNPNDQSIRLEPPDVMRNRWESEFEKAASDVAATGAAAEEEGEEEEEEEDVRMVAAMEADRIASEEMAAKIQGAEEDGRRAEAEDERRLAEVRLAENAVITRSESAERIGTKFALPSVVVDHQVTKAKLPPEAIRTSNMSLEWQPEMTHRISDSESEEMRKFRRPKRKKWSPPCPSSVCCFGFGRGFGKASEADKLERQRREATLTRLTNGKTISIISSKITYDDEITYEELDEHWLPVFEKYVGATGCCYQNCLPASLRTDPALPVIVLYEYLNSNTLARTRHGWCYRPFRLPEKSTDNLKKWTDDAGADDWIAYGQFSYIVVTGQEMRIGLNQSEFGRMLQHYLNAFIPKFYHQYWADCNPPPFFIPIITLIQLILFIYYTASLGNGGASSPVPFRSAIIFDPHRRYEVWRYVTYVLLHAGYVHFIINLLIQLTVGLPLEIVHKWWRIGLIYLLGTFGGSLAHSITDYDTFLVGASGGVYALLVAHLANVLLNYKDMRFGKLKIIILSTLIIIDTTYAIFERYALTEAEGAGGTHTVGYAAHFGGAITGFLVGVLVLRNIRELPWERTLWVVGIIVYVVLVLFAILFNGFYQGYPNSDWIYGSHQKL